MFARLREEIAVVFERDPAARNTWEVVTCYPGFHAMLFHRLAHGLWKAFHDHPWLIWVNQARPLLGPNGLGAMDFLLNLLPQDEAAPHSPPAPSSEPAAGQAAT